MKIIYAGDRALSVEILRFILEQGVQPLGLLLSNKRKASHDEELRDLCNFLDETQVFRGADIKNGKAEEFLSLLDFDYMICIHFPYMIPKTILDIPKYGALNLHPSYLPYGRGWHSASWAIKDEIPYGATLHFMDETLDTGDIVKQSHIKIFPDDTADILCKRVLKAEVELFKEVWPLLVSGKYGRKKQTSTIRDMHFRRDLKTLQSLDLNEITMTKDLIKRLRALTTNDIKEAAYFEINDTRYYVQVSITKETL